MQFPVRFSQRPILEEFILQWETQHGHDHPLVTGSHRGTWIRCPVSSESKTFFPLGGQEKSGKKFTWNQWQISTRRRRRCTFIRPKKWGGVGEANGQQRNKWRMLIFALWQWENQARLWHLLYQIYSFVQHQFHVRTTRHEFFLLPETNWPKN